MELQCAEWMKSPARLQHPQEESGSVTTAALRLTQTVTADIFLFFLYSQSVSLTGTQSGFQGIKQCRIISLFAWVFFSGGLNTHGLSNTGNGGPVELVWDLAIFFKSVRGRSSTSVPEGYRWLRRGPHSLTAPTAGFFFFCSNWNRSTWVMLNMKSNLHRTTHALWALTLALKYPRLDMNNGKTWFCSISSIWSLNMLFWGS